MILLVKSDVRAIPLQDASVDCIVTSPPYWGLPGPRDIRNSRASQRGAEAATRKECWGPGVRVLIPISALGRRAVCCDLTYHDLAKERTKELTIGMGLM